MQVSLRISLRLISRIATLFFQFNNSGAANGKFKNFGRLHLAKELESPDGFVKKVETARTEKND